MTTIERFSERAIEPVATCLVRMLMVPDIYVQVPWAGLASQRPDLIAIDRAGHGDVHVVEIKESAEAAIDAASLLFSIPAHYRWLAYPLDSLVPEGRLNELEFTAGQGRIGLIGVFVMADQRLGARATTPSERAFTDLHDAVSMLRHDARPYRSFREEVG